MTTQENPSQSQAPGKAVWLKRANEHPRAYAAFKVYRDMGPERSIKKVVRSHGKAKATLETWSRRHGWQERVAAWDADQEEKRRKAEDEALKQEAAVWAIRQREVRQRDWDDAQTLRSKVRDMLNFPLTTRVVRQDGQEIHIHPAKFTLNNCARMLDIASKLERLATGLNTEKLEITGKDDTPVLAAHGQVVIVELPPGRLADDAKGET